jgi:hypothetical protein
MTGTGDDSNKVLVSRYRAYELHRPHAFRSRQILHVDVYARKETTSSEIMGSR